MIYAGVKI